MIAKRALGLLPACARQRAAIGLALSVFIAASAGAVLTDDEPNDTIADAAANAHMVKSGPVTTDGGELELVAGDIDFLGVAALSVGDIVTVTTTPLEDPPDLHEPDTVVGLFDSTTIDPTNEILCRGDNARNNDLQNCPGGECVGRGSLCRFKITAPGNYYVGVTGFRPKNPGGCTPGVNCISFPFDGGIGATPCSESSGDSLTCGTYQVTIAVRSLPEPGLLFQLASGCVGLLVLDRRRRSANR